MKKIAVVTGGAQGIGKGITKSLLEHDMIVVVLDSDFDANELLKKEYSAFADHLFSITCDVGSEPSIIDTVSQIQNKYSDIDYLVNNAGVFFYKPIEEMSLDEWNKVLAVNLTSIFLLTKYLKPLFRNDKGAIVNMASTRAFMSEANTESYSASKGGVVALTHALAVSLGPNIHVNSISPGWIDVSGCQKNSVQYQLTEQDNLQHPVGRVGVPNDVAEMVLFLLSEKSGFITGQNFTVDGGMTVKMIYEE